MKKSENLSADEYFQKILQVCKIMKPVSIICWCPETYARSSVRISFDSDLFVTYARRRSTPVSTVLWKLVRFFIINIFLIKRPSKLKSCKLFSTI